jgi:hypothetical protein
MGCRCLAAEHTIQTLMTVSRKRNLQGRACVIFTQRLCEEGRCKRATCQHRLLLPQAAAAAAEVASVEGAAAFGSARHSNTTASCDEHLLPRTGERSGCAEYMSSKPWLGTQCLLELCCLPIKCCHILGNKGVFQPTGLPQTELSNSFPGVYNAKKALQRLAGL